MTSHKWWRWGRTAFVNDPNHQKTRRCRWWNLMRLTVRSLPYTGLDIHKREMRQVKCFLPVPSQTHDHPVPVSRFHFQAARVVQYGFLGKEDRGTIASRGFSSPSSQFQCQRIKWPATASASSWASGVAIWRASHDSSHSSTISVKTKSSRAWLILVERELGCFNNGTLFFYNLN